MLTKLIALLTRAERKRTALVVGMALVMALIDMLGVASILPLIAVLANPELVHANAALNTVFSASHYIGIHTTEQFMFFLAVLVFVLLVTSLAFKALTIYVQTRFVLMCEYSIGRRLVEGYLNQPYSWFLSRHSADLGKTILSEVNAVVSGGLGPLMSLIAQSAVVLALLVLLVIVDPLLALTVGLVLGVAYAGVYFVMRGSLKRLGRERADANKGRFTAVNEAFGAAKEVKIGGLERAYVQRFAKPAEIYVTSQAAARAIAQLPRFALEAIAFGGMILVILYIMAKTDSFATALPILAVYAFTGYRLLPALQQIYAAVTELSYVGPGLDALCKDLGKLQTVKDGLPDQISPLPFKNEITLNNVSYHYPDASRQALKGIDLTISVRSKIGFVGATGSGKTTTVDVILGLLQPHEGELKIDGQPLTAANCRHWQRAIGYVPQHIYLADDSVAANIAFGVNLEDIDQHAVERAARIANLHKFVIDDLPKGYATSVGERGVRLSGGQRQRIGIARALYRNPQVLILDEATSALDNLTEQAVMDAVNNIGGQTTIILIAHRLSTVRHCDEIHLLERGEIIASGTYEQLASTSQQFKAIAEATP